MDAKIECPNCGAPIGESSYPNGEEIKHYYYKNDMGAPICKKCGYGKTKSQLGCVIVLLIIIIVFSAFSEIIYQYYN